MKKLMIKESVNKMSDEVYDNIALLGYACTLASNDLHHIHLCAIGDKFQEIHESADEYLSKVRELNDFCLELAKEGGLETYNETFANDVIKDAGNDWKVAEDKEYDFVKAFTEISNILTDLSQFIMIIEDMEGVTSDVTSVLDEYLREFTKAVNYFIDKKLADTEEILVGQTESLRKNRKSNIKESYKDSKEYKKLAEYDYKCEVKGNKVIIKWADDGAVYAEFTLTSPEEMFADTDIDPYDDFGKAHGFDCWVIDDGNGFIDTYAKTYDDAIVSAINYFWSHY